jgi:hypothetical protein
VTGIFKAEGSAKAREEACHAKDVKNRGNELKNSFRIKRSPKKTNSKRTGFVSILRKLDGKVGQKQDIAKSSPRCRPALRTV